MEKVGSPDGRIAKETESQGGARGTVFVTTNVASDASVTGRLWRKVISNDDTTTITSVHDEDDNDVTSDMAAGSEVVLAGNFLVIPFTIGDDHIERRPKIKKVVYTSTNKMIGVL